MGTELSEGTIHKSRHERINAAIGVDTFIEKYNVTHRDVAETLYKFPVLSYLLGSVTKDPQGTDSRPDGVARPYWTVTDGSAMFGLKNPEDVMRWKGIFTHITGAARHVYFLADTIAHATPEQKKKLLDLGYTPASLVSLDPDALRDQKLIDHAGRRQMDESVWHGIHDTVHPSTYSEKNTLALLEEMGADPYFLHHMKEEDHAYLLSREKNGRLKDVQFAILTYGDWTYDQKPMVLADRFAGLRSRQRADEKTLGRLQKMGETFETDLTYVFGDSFIQKMMNHAPYEWEYKMRNAYAASAGLSASQVFSA